MSLTGRGEEILKVIVGEYIAGAIPVASQTITYNHSLDISPATVRNDMVYLEEEGYIMRPHASAGAIPTDLINRVYKTCLIVSELLNIGVVLDGFAAFSAYDVGCDLD